MNICPLTGQIINLLQRNPSVEVFFYETYKTGRVEISDIAFHSAQSLSSEEKQILTGITRNQSIRNEEPLQITCAFLNQLNNQHIPYGFEERANHLLQYLHDKEGKGCSYMLNSDFDSPITYSSKEEFERIIIFLKGEGWIKYEKKMDTPQATIYQGLKISKSGKRVTKGMKRKRKD